MANDSIRASRDWLANTRTSALAWWIPQVAIVGGLFVPVAVRAVIWIIALIWMGTACIVNARRCNRTHCRYTGPYYLAMIVPVLALDSGAQGKSCTRAIASETKPTTAMSYESNVRRKSPTECGDQSCRGSHDTDLKGVAFRIWAAVLTRLTCDRAVTC
jgi:hypothetical protein